MTATTGRVPRVLVISAEPVGARMAGPAIRALELARALAATLRRSRSPPPRRANWAASSGSRCCRPGSRTTRRCWPRSGPTTSSSPSCCRRACWPRSGAARSGSWSTSTTRPSSRCSRPPAASRRGSRARLRAHRRARGRRPPRRGRPRAVRVRAPARPVARRARARRRAARHARSRAARLPRRRALRRPGRAAGPGRRARPARRRARHRRRRRACCCGAAASGTGSTRRPRSARPPGSRTARPPSTSSSRASAGRRSRPRDEHAATARAMTLARELGLDGRRVHFNHGWMPYAERGRWLLEADLGLSATSTTSRRASPTARGSLDYLWAGLPVLATAGDALGERVAAEGAGRTVAAGRRRGAGRRGSRAARRRPRPAARRSAAAARRGAALGPRRGAAGRASARTAPSGPVTAARRRRVAAATLGQYPAIARETLATDGPGALAASRRARTALRASRSRR